MLILEFSNEITTTDNGEPAIKLLCRRGGNPLEKRCHVVDMVWLSPFSKHNFQITKQPGGGGCLVNSIQTGLCEAIDFITKRKEIGYVSDCDKEFTGKTHLAGLISLAIIEYANKTFLVGEAYRMPKIKYVSDYITAEQENVTALCRFIDMVYDYLQK